MGGARTMLGDGEGRLGEEVEEGSSRDMVGGKWGTHPLP